MVFGRCGVVFGHAVVFGRYAVVFGQHYFGALLTSKKLGLALPKKRGLAVMATYRVKL